MGVAFCRYLLVEQRFADAGPRDPKTRYAVDGVDCQAEAIRLVFDGQFQRRVDVPLLLVPTHMNVVLARPPICKPVNQPWIRMKVEDDRFVRCEDGFEFPVRQTVGMFYVGDQPEKIDNVYESHFHVG